MRTRELAYLRPDEILSEMAARPVAYLPLGLLEWHGPHLPLGVDALHAQAVALRVAEMAGGLVMPPVYCGTERERGREMLEWLGFEGNEWIVGMDFPANSLPSMYAPQEIFALTVAEQLRQLSQFGFKLIVALSGHGATNQLQELERLAAAFNAQGGAQVLVDMPFVIDEEGQHTVGHASRVETAAMLAIAPETVAPEELPSLPQPLANRNWAIVDYQTFAGEPTAEHTVHEIDDPRRATAEEGVDNMEKTAARLAQRVQQALAALD